MMTIGLRRRRTTMIALACLTSMALGPQASAHPVGGQSATVQHHRAVQGRHARLARALHSQLENYLDEHAQDRMTAASLRVSYPHGRPATSVSASVGRPIPENALWQLGSNTKAFTAVLILRLEAEGRLSTHDTLGTWLPQYPQWRDVTIEQLLSMTSGIPDYAQQDAFGEAIVSDPSRRFTPQQLVSYVTDLPVGPAAYSYSNTNFLLAQLVIERAGKDTYAAQLRRHILRPLGLHDTCLPPYCPPGTARRMPAGHSAQSGLPPTFGDPVPPLALSWAQGAGGLVSSLKDMSTWDRALYRGRMLPPAQQRKLLSLVSVTSSRPIAAVTPDDPVGYGLGVAQRIDSSTGRPVWSYRGETFGFQVIHTYVPQSQLVISLAVNSATDQDTLTALADAVHRTVDRMGAVSR